nr:immunoglobulin heavy chain junction region [Macaca mulatta]MOX59225.1 immunoglobulin heavy chain junction region [Macaca mulatta]MOX59563.1 immunoglobulin heavy chain junction region [Macaca mulatta]MOX59626.1 immunoglobulin heavy chain junction region [Macaca mulatta]MOX59841.1 immunoglobulin heavy chain junction region [Macaca mulatta]
CVRDVRGTGFDYW